MFVNESPDVEQLFYSPWEESLLRILTHVLGTHASAEDVLQDAKLKMIRGSKRQQHLRIDSVKLAAVAAEIAVDRIRVLAMQTEAHVKLVPLVTAISVSVEEEQIQVEEEDTLDERLQQAIENLPENLRAVVLAGHVEKLRRKIISRQLGISERTVERRLGRGMQILRDKLLPAGSHRNKER